MVLSDGNLLSLFLRQRHPFLSFVVFGSSRSKNVLPRDVVVALAVAALHRPAPQNFFTVTTVEQATYTHV
jgi:hypothetical protein